MCLLWVCRGYEIVVRGIKSRQSACVVNCLFFSSLVMQCCAMRITRLRSIVLMLELTRETLSARLFELQAGPKKMTSFDCHMCD